MTDAELQAAVIANGKVLTEHFDPNFSISLEKNLFDSFNAHYFRSRFIGFDEIPKRNNPDKPMIYICNHSGMAFPWDAMVLGSGFLKLNKHEFKDAFRPLVAPMLSQSNLMNPYCLPAFWKRTGGIDATVLNFETMMHYNESNALIYPEGVPGIGKGFNHKYELQQFSSSFVRMALKHKTDIIPILTVNGEYINPWSYKIDAIDRLTRRIGIPFLPLSPLLLLIPIFPWIFFFAFPARLTYVLGQRIKVYEMTDTPYAKITTEEVKSIRDRVRAAMQADLDAAVKLHGQEPFRWRELLLNNLKHIDKVAFFSSPGWPMLFHEHDRAFAAKGEKDTPDMKIGFFSIFGILLRNPFTIFFFIPILGWIPLIIKGYRGNSINHKQVSTPK